MLIEPARQTLARLQGRQNRAARRRGMSRPASGFARASTIWEHPRPATLLRGVGIDLKEMLVEIEAWAVVPSKK
jgi:hypothetical protein